MKSMESVLTRKEAETKETQYILDNWESIKQYREDDPYKSSASSSSSPFLYLSVAPPPLVVASIDTPTQNDSGSSGRSTSSPYPASLLRLMRLYLKFATTQFPNAVPLSTSSHVCTSDCKFYSQESIDPDCAMNICMASGNLHHCSELTCGYTRSVNHICMQHSRVAATSMSSPMSKQKKKSMKCSELTCRTIPVYDDLLICPLTKNMFKMGTVGNDGDLYGDESHHQIDLPRRSGTTATTITPSQQQYSSSPFKWERHDRIDGKEIFDEVFGIQTEPVVSPQYRKFIKHSRSEDISSSSSSLTPPFTPDKRRRTTRTYPRIEVSSPTSMSVLPVATTTAATSINIPTVIKTNQMDSSVYPSLDKPRRRRRVALKRSLPDFYQQQSIANVIIKDAIGKEYCCNEHKPVLSHYCCLIWRCIVSSPRYGECGSGATSYSFASHCRVVLYTMLTGLTYRDETIIVPYVSCLKSLIPDPTVLLINNLSSRRPRAASINRQRRTSLRKKPSTPASSTTITSLTRRFKEFISMLPKESIHSIKQLSRIN